MQHDEVIWQVLQPLCAPTLKGLQYWTIYNPAESAGDQSRPLQLQGQDQNPQFLQKRIQCDWSM